MANKRKTHSEFLSAVGDTNIMFISEYKGRFEPIDCKCKIDGYEWKSKPDVFLRGQGCPKCAGKRGNEVVRDNGNFISVDVSTRSYKSKTMLLDKTDWEYMKSIGVGRFSLNTGGYAQCWFKGQQVLAHKITEKARKNKDCEIDHINRDKLDNRSCNLRFVSRSQNMMNTGLRSDNTSGHAGVSFSKSVNSWVAYICKNGKQMHIGVFKNKKDAINARVLAEQELFGKYSPHGANVRHRQRCGG